MKRVRYVTKKETILEEVLALLHTHASEKFTMKNLADHLGRSKSSLYEYFPSKQDMITEALEHLMAVNQSVVITPLPSDDFKQNLKDYFKRVMRLVEEKRMMQNLVYHPEVNTLPSAMQSRLKQKMQEAHATSRAYLWTIMDQGIQSGDISGPITAERKHVIESMMVGTMVEMSHQGLPFDKDTYLHELIDSIICVHQKQGD
jgi:AcrR family transcriptional regulator